MLNFCSHSRIHTHAHTRTRAHAHTHTHIHTYIHTHAHTRTHTYTHIHTYIHTHTPLLQVAIEFPSLKEKWEKSGHRWPPPPLPPAHRLFCARDVAGASASASASHIT